MQHNLVLIWILMNNYMTQIKAVGELFSKKITKKQAKIFRKKYFEMYPELKRLTTRIKKQQSK